MRIRVTPRRRWIRHAWTAALFLLPVAMLANRQVRGYNWAILKDIRLVTLGLSVLMVVATVKAAAGLRRLRPWFRQTLWSLVTRPWKPAAAPRVSTNWQLLPAEVKYIGPVYLMLWMANIPVFALIEEYIFRRGTQSWTEALLRSVLFGLVHLLAGIDLAAALAITLPGLWHSYQYFQGDVYQAVLFHSAYDIIVLAWLLVEIIRFEVLEWTTRRAKIATAAAVVVATEQNNPS